MDPRVKQIDDDIRNKLQSIKTVLELSKMGKKIPQKMFEVAGKDVERIEKMLLMLELIGGNMLDGKKIVIAEDDLRMVEIYKDYFAFKKDASKGKFYYATNVKECVDLLETEKPHILLLDLALEDKMPPPGLEILKNYKNKVKIIVISGYHEHEDECLSGGALKFLKKPMDLKDILQVIVNCS